jgi:hypothetical protein
LKKLTHFSKKLHRSVSIVFLFTILRIRDTFYSLTTHSSHFRKTEKIGNKWVQNQKKKCWFHLDWVTFCILKLMHFDLHEIIFKTTMNIKKKQKPWLWLDEKTYKKLKEEEFEWSLVQVHQFVVFVFLNLKWFKGI